VLLVPLDIAIKKSYTPYSQAAREGREAAKARGRAANAGTVQQRKQVLGSK